VFIFTVGYIFYINTLGAADNKKTKIYDNVTQMNTYCLDFIYTYLYMCYNNE